MIDPEGNFFRYYPDLLIVRQHNEVLEPWTHEVLLDVAESSFLQIIMSSEQAESMLVKIYKKSTGARIKHNLTTMSETNSVVQEYKVIFKLEANTAYLISLEYSGDMYNAYGEEEPCSYFDLTIAINSISGLSEKLSCDSSTTVADAESLLTALPREITEKDMNFKINGLYILKYPQDFKEIKFKSNAKQSMAMLLPTVLDIQDPF